VFANARPYYLEDALKWAQRDTGGDSTGVLSRLYLREAVARTAALDLVQRLRLELVGPDGRMMPATSSSTL
jgi:hypothetical protein